MASTSSISQFSILGTILVASAPLYSSPPFPPYLPTPGTKHTVLSSTTTTSYNNYNDMATTTRGSFLFLFTLLVILAFATPAAAFGAGNIASIAKIEGKNWRHGDIEDTLKTLAALRGGKWTAMNIRRVYFGNWLRDYSQALDVGTLKSVPKDTIRVLVWVLSFLSFGYATGEFEVTEERLGVYRPEEHIGEDAWCRTSLVSGTSCSLSAR
jgi:hypothetical protein